MNKYLKAFLHRGLIFGGFGPIIMGIIFFVLSLTIDGFSLGGSEVLVAILSTYALAFIHAGASVFNQIESWPLAKSLAAHFSILYLSYLLCYISNSWIPFEPMVILFFTAIFTLTYFVIWGTVVISIKHASKKFNEKLGA